jgi:outer membrane protein OmpA-like peptidoglycan-associated protein
MGLYFKSYRRVCLAALVLLVFQGYHYSQNRGSNAFLGYPSDTVWLTHENELKDNFVVEGIFFQLGSFDLIPISDSARGVLNPKRMYHQLDSLAQLLIKDEGRFEVQGHLDSRVSNRSSRHLSYRRAQSVREYLIGQGVSADQLIFKGFEGDVPRWYFDTQLTDEYILQLPTAMEKEQMHQLNRRVEIMRLE